MERYCITLEQAKRLVELGLDRPCGFVWLQFRNISSPPDQHHLVHTVLESVLDACGYEDREYLEDLEMYSAYHVGELGDLLPEDVRTYRYDGLWSVYFPVDGIMELFKESYPTEAQARGALLIYLIENKLI